MSKTKKSKLLASMLCATVVAGLYAGPVMAGSVDRVTGDSSGIHIDIGHEKDGNTSIHDGVVTGSDGIYLTGSRGNEEGGLLYHIAGKLTITSEAMVNALEGKSFNELTIGGQTFNAGFATEYANLKSEVASLSASDDNVAGIKRSVTEKPYGYQGSKVVTKTTSIEDGALEVTRVEKYDADGDLINDAWSPKNTITANGKMIVNDSLEVDKGIKAAGEKFVVNGVNGNVTTVGSITANGAEITTTGNGKFKVKNIDGNTMAYMVDKDGNYTVGINAQNGNIETKGALAVTNADGANAFTANSNGISVGGGLFAVDAATGNTNIAGGLNVGTNIEVKGAISANSLTLDGMNVGDAITDLQNDIGSIDGDVSALNGRVTSVEGKTAGITNVNGVTTVKKGLAVIGQTGNDGNPLKVFEVSQNGEINAFVPDWNNNAIANFAMNSENVELKYGDNGMFADINGTIINGNGNEIKLNADGATFTNHNNGTSTIINGGAITADSLTLANLDEDVATEINNLKDTMGTVGGDVADLRTDVNQNTYDIGVLRTDVGVLRTDVNTLRVDVNSLNQRLEIVEDKTQNINADNTYGPGEQPSGSGDVHEGGNTDFTGNINSDSVTTGEITADKGTIGGVTMEDGSLTADKATIGDVTVGGSLNVADKVTADKDGVTVKGDGENNVKIDGNDVNVSWKDDEGNSYETSIRDNYEAINDLDNRVTGEVNRLDSRIDKVEDRVDKVGAMAAAIANLRTMGYDPTAPTEIAVGIGQYRSETGAALGLFHYPNKDFMLSLSVSTSGDEVMGGIGATWKFGRKSPEQMLAAEKEKAAKAKLAKAEAMKKAAAEAKVAEQQAKHAKMAAEKAAK